MSLIDELSVFFPTYNEEGNIETVVAKTKKVLEKVAGKWEIIIVEDGSGDRTPQIADKIARTDKRIRVVHHKLNRGYGGALKTGFESAKYKWVAFTDSDGQFDFAEVEKFIAKKDEADLVLGYRKKRADSIARVLFTFGWATLARILLGLKAKDYSCGFKMIKKSVYQAIQPLVGEEKVTQIEMLVKARKMGYRFAEVGVNHYPRASGKPTGANLKVVAKSVVDMFKLWGKMHGVGKTEFIILLIILAVGSFLRLYKIDGYMTFLGDEGRDVIIASRLLKEGHPPLIGPGTSIGNMYLGPIYYYMMAPALFLANFSPVGPAVQIALLGVLTIAFVWYVGREWFSPLAGLIASGLYAIAPTVIVYSRSSWNPNIMPFFAILCIYSIWRVWTKHQYKWLVVMGVSFAFVLQSHYLGLLLLPTMGIFWLLTLRNLLREKKNKLGFYTNTIVSVVLFLALMSPLVIFDARHGWINSMAMKKFFSERQTTVSVVPWKAVPNIWPIYENVIERLPGGRNRVAGIALSAILSLFIVIKLITIKKLDQKYRRNFLLLLCWLIFGLLGLGLYKQHIYDHYYGFFFAAAFLLTGATLQEMVKRKSRILTVVTTILVLGLIYSNLSQSPLLSPPTMQLLRAETVARKVVEVSEGERFNFSLIADANYDSGYRYFLNLYGAKVVDIDPQKADATITNQLLVVCEKEKAKCDPTHNPKAEIAGFGWTKVEKEYDDVFGVTLYKLVHTK